MNTNMTGLRNDFCSLIPWTKVVSAMEDLRKGCPLLEKTMYLNPYAAGG